MGNGERVVQRPSCGLFEPAACRTGHRLELSKVALLQDDGEGNASVRRHVGRVSQPSGNRMRRRIERDRVGRRGEQQDHTADEHTEY